MCFWVWNNLEHIQTFSFCEWDLTINRLDRDAITTKLWARGGGGGRWQLQKWCVVWALGNFFFLSFFCVFFFFFWLTNKLCFEVQSSSSLFQFFDFKNLYYKFRKNLKKSKNIRVGRTNHKLGGSSLRWKEFSQPLLKYIKNWKNQTLKHYK